MANMINILLIISGVVMTMVEGFNLSNTLGSNMVLNSNAPNFWGWDTPSSTVTLHVQSYQLETQTNEAGEWAIPFFSQEAGAGPWNFTFTSSGGESIVLENVLMGHVYICGGQSNMQFTVSQGFNATAEIAAADKYPNIRVFSVGTSTYSSTPLNSLAKFDLGWSVASSATVGGADWAYMSAVCWFFARDLYDRYQVPIGIVSSNWGGTVIQAWSSPKALAACNASTSTISTNSHKISTNSHKMDVVNEDNDITGAFRVGDQNSDSVLWNAMIVPFLPMSLTGVIWYQGEQNVGQAALYACMEPAMITDWRANFQNPQMPFMFTQLAPWTSGSSDPAVADLRAAQLAALNLNAVGYASAIDLGDATSPYGSIHPRDKQTVGARLVQAARAIVYNEPNIIWQGPTYKSHISYVNSSDSNLLNIVVTFDLNGSEGLEIKQNITCPSGVPSADCSNFEIDINGNILEATTVYLADSSSVHLVIGNSGQISQPNTFQYAYNIWPVATIFNKEGLPAIPFQVDF